MWNVFDLKISNYNSKQLKANRLKYLNDPNVWKMLDK